MYQFLLKPILFLFPAESAHHITLRVLKIVLALPIVGTLFKAMYQFKHPKLHRKVLGLHFSNSVGLAAGFDKDGQHYEAMASLGFGFIELGTVTPRPQAGNPQPRLFRLPVDHALINRMGFNNEGVDALVGRLKKSRPEHIVIGGNIGKNKTTPNEQASEDYLYCFEALFDHVDYFVVNVSSPNTPGLRALQDKTPLTQLLSLLQVQNQSKSKPKPILLKIAPDLNEAQLDDILDIVEHTRIDGVIATNTTISREGLDTAAQQVEAIGMGGLSGRPLEQRSTEVIRYLNDKSKGKLTIIGVGGIETAEDALAKLEAGASLVQIYSGLIYKGPSLVKEINQAILSTRLSNVRPQHASPS